MSRPSTSFYLGDVSTGEPHLYCLESLTNRRYLARLGQDTEDLHLRTATAIDLPRISPRAFGAAAAIVFCLLGVPMAQGPGSIDPAGRTAAECTERDLKVTALIGGRGDPSYLTDAVRGEAGLAQLAARLACRSGRKVEALAKYDRILAAPHFAQYAKGAGE